MRPVTTVVVSLAMALGAIGLAVAAPGAGGELARAEVHAASGAVTMSNPKAGQALFSASGIRPGDSVAGEVTIGNDGDHPGRFAVRVIDVVDSGAGKLSERVELTLFDDDDELHAATPADFGELDLGVIAPGQSRDYRFVATLPGSAGNSFQGSGLSLGFEWQASPVAGAATPTPASPTTPVREPAAPARPTTPVTPVRPVTPPPVAIADAIGLPAPKSCVKAGRLTFRVKAPAGAKVLTVTVKVNGRVKARLKGKKAAKPVNLRGLKKKTKLAVSVKASDRRTYSASRTYKACRK